MPTIHIKPWTWGASTRYWTKVHVCAHTWETFGNVNTGSLLCMWLQESMRTVWAESKGQPQYMKAHWHHRRNFDPIKAYSRAVSKTTFIINLFNNLSSWNFLHKYACKHAKFIIIVCVQPSHDALLKSFFTLLLGPPLTGPVARGWATMASQQTQG